MSNRVANVARYPLRAVIRRTGLSADVLRAWERRYGAVDPKRSEGGQRLYSAEDVERLVRLQRATAAGHSISEIARLDSGALDALLASDGGQRPGGEVSAVDITVRDALLATEQLDTVALEGALKRGAFTAGTEVFIDEIVPRLMQSVGERWHRGSLTPAHEHLASDTVRRVLAWIGEAYHVPTTAPMLLVATPVAEMHELGAMLVAAAAAAAGWRVLYLGASLPAADIVAAAVQAGARAVALSVVYADGESTLHDLRGIADALPASVPLIVGGMAAVRLARAVADERIRVVGDLAEFRSLLRERQVPVLRGGTD